MRDATATSQPGSSAQPAGDIGNATMQTQKIQTAQRSRFAVLAISKFACHLDLIIVLR